MHRFAGSLILILPWTLQQLQIGLHHLFNEAREVDLSLPAELLLRLGRVSVEEIDFGRSIIPRIDSDKGLPRLPADADFFIL